MFAIGLFLVALSIILYVVLDMNDRGVDGWRGNVTYGSFCLGVLLAAISTFIWLWRVMP